MMKEHFSIRILGGIFAFALIPGSGHSQLPSPPSNSQADLHIRVVLSQSGKHRSVPVVIWLQPLPGTSVLPFKAKGRYILEQKNRTFVPHLQVVPVGSSVQFPNEDPFFHNVFSLFDGKRFDLGLYEAGSSKSVTFSREGISYIFCNIHPEMSAVVISLTTPLYAIANGNDPITLRNIPFGDYRMQIWIEGVPQSILEKLFRDIHIQAGGTDLGELKVPIPTSRNSHTNEFGHPYEQVPESPY